MSSHAAKMLPFVLLLAIPACNHDAPANAAGSATANQLIGKWEALPSAGLPAGGREVWEFKPDGTFSDTMEGADKASKTILGQYHVSPEGRITTDHTSDPVLTGTLAKRFSVQGDMLTMMTTPDGMVFGFKRVP